MSLLMTFEQKLMALKALDNDVSLRIRKPGDWYVWARIERKEGGVLSGGGGNGASDPSEAVIQFFDWATDPKFYIVIGAYTEKRKAVKWNGFMWEDVREDKR